MDDDTIGIPNSHESRKQEKGVPHRKGQGIKLGLSRGGHGTSREDWTSERIRQLYALHAARLPYDEMRYFLEMNRSIDSLKSRVYSVRAGNAGNANVNIVAWNQERDSGVIWTISRDRTEVTSSDGRRYRRIHTSLPKDHIHTNAREKQEAAQAKRSLATRPVTAKKTFERSKILSTDAVSDTSNLEPRQIAPSPVVRANTLAQPRSQNSAVVISQYQSSVVIPSSSTFRNEYAMAPPQPLGLINRRVRSTEKGRAAQATTLATIAAVRPLYADRTYLGSQPPQPAGLLCSRVGTVHRPQAFTTGTSRPALSPYPPSNPPTPEWREQQRRRSLLQNAEQTPNVNAEWIHRNYGAGHSAEAAAYAARAAEIERTHISMEQFEAQQQASRDGQTWLYWEQRREQRQRQRQQHRDESNADDVGMAGGSWLTMQ